MLAQTNSIKSFAELFQKATEGTGRVALYSAFLLLAFRLGVPRNERSRVLGVLVALMLSKKSG